MHPDSMKGPQDGASEVIYEEVPIPTEPPVEQKLAEVSDDVTTAVDALYAHPLQSKDILTMQWGSWHVLVDDLDLGSDVRSGLGADLQVAIEPTVLPAGCAINVDPNNSNANGVTMNSDFVRIKVDPRGTTAPRGFLQVPKVNLENKLVRLGKK